MSPGPPDGSTGEALHNEGPPSKPAAPPTDTLPDHFGRYQVRSRLGKGGFGEVFRGWDPQVDRDVAIKVLRADLLATPERVAHFLDEARKAGKLEQPGVVSIYDVGQDQGRCYIVERFIDGPTLAARLAEGPIKTEETVRLVVRLAEVLHEAHAKGWVHRDIKPANVLLDKAGAPHLADFGLAMELETMRGTDSAFGGTPRYMAPEVIAQALGQTARGVRGRLPRPDHRCDIYSLGVVLYEMLTGRPPYQAGTREELFAMIDRAEPTPPRLINPAVPAALEEVCLKAIAHDPAQRFRTSADFAEALLELNRPTTPAVPPAPAPALPPATHRLPVWVVVLAACLFTLLVIVILLRRPQDDPPTPTPVPSQPPTAALGPAELKAMLRALRDEMDESRERVRSGLPSANASPPKRDAVDEKLPGPFQAKFEGPLNEARAKGDEDREFSLLLAATNELIGAGHPGPARALALRMVEVSGKDEARLPIAYGQLGLAEYKLGWAEEAIASYERGNRTYEKLHEKLMKTPAVPRVLEMRSSMARMLGINLNRIGNANKALKRIQNARAAYERAIVLLEPHEDRTSELAMVLSNLGSLESGAGEHKAAATALERALALARAQGDAGDVCDILINLGNARSRAGDEAAAVAAYREAYESMPPAVPYESRSAVLTNWIESLVTQERLEEARRLLPELRRIARPDDEAAKRAIELLGPIVEGRP